MSSVYTILNSATLEANMSVGWNVEVSFFLLTRNPYRYRVLRAYTNCPRLQRVTKPILTEPNRRFRS